MNEIRPTDIKKTIYATANLNLHANIYITEPRSNTEICSITLDPIQENPTICDFQISGTPLQSKPNHSCIQLSCNHRFNGMALLIHFAKNSMTCPMCRSGIESKLNFWASFPHEPWLEIMQNIIHDPQRHNVSSVPDNGIFLHPMQRFPTVFVLRELIENSLQDGPVLPETSNDDSAYRIDSDFNVYAVFHMYRNHRDENLLEDNNERPAVSLQCDLLINNNRRGYTISPTFARIVSDAINDMNVRSISAIIYARNIMHNTCVQIANMQRTLLTDGQREIVANVSPPIYTISITLNSSQNTTNNEDNNIMQFLDFIFVPGEHTFTFFTTN